MGKPTGFFFDARHRERLIVPSAAREGFVPSSKPSAMEVLMTEDRYKKNIHSKMTGLTIGALALVAVSTPTLAAQPNEVFKAMSAVQVQGNPLASFDISFVDPQLSKYFLADRSNAAIDVLKTGVLHPTATTLGKGSFVGVALSGGKVDNDHSGPNGVITANDHKEVWAGDGPKTVTNDTKPFAGTPCAVLDISKCSHVVVIDINKDKVTHQINTGGLGRSDELCVDPDDNVVLIANDVGDAFNGVDKSDLFISFISTKGAKAYNVIGTIEFRDGKDPNAMGVVATGGIEQCQYRHANRMFYLALPSTEKNSAGAVLVIDPQKMKVEQVFDQAFSSPHCVGPAGLALGPGTQILLGCSNSGTDTVVIDADSGNLLFVLGGLNGNDEVWFNPGDSHYFLGGGNHLANGKPDPILGIADASTENVTEDQSVPSKVGSHSVAAEPRHNLVYLPINNAEESEVNGGPSEGNEPSGEDVCSQFGIEDSQGCILILKSVGPPDRFGNGKFIRGESD